MITKDSSMLWCDVLVFWVGFLGWVFWVGFSGLGFLGWVFWVGFSGLGLWDAKYYLFTVLDFGRVTYLTWPDLTWPDPTWPDLASWSNSTTISAYTHIYGWDRPIFFRTYSPIFGTNLLRTWTTLSLFGWNRPGLGPHYHHFDAAVRNSFAHMGRCYDLL